MQLEELCRKVNQIVLKTGQFIREESQKVADINIEEKSKNSLVSYVDKTAEDMLVRELGALIPDAGFLTEEDTVNILGKEWEWIIDPLDDTTNFLYGIPAYSVSVGLRRNEELVLGVVYEINRDELFYGWLGGGAYLNQKKINLSNRPTIEKSLLATGFPYYDFTTMKEYMKGFEVLVERARGIRRIGSAAVDLVYVACGRFDGFFEYTLNSWDVAGGAMIVLEAGGIITGFNPGTDYLFDKELVATNGLIHEELLSVFQ